MNFRYIHALTLLLITLLAGCVSEPQSSSSTTAAQQPQNAAQWLQRARASTGTEQHHALLEASQLLVNHGSLHGARVTLARLPTELNAELTQQRYLIQAEIALAEGDTEGANAQVAAVNEQQLTEHTKPVWLQVKEQIARQNNQLWQAAQYLSQRFAYFEDQAQQRKASEQMRTYLAQSSRDLTMKAPLAAAPDPFSGWVSLYRLLNGIEGNSAQLLNNIKQWQHSYPNHPATLWLPDNLETLLENQSQAPHKVAVFLPLSGTYQRQGQAIRDGLIYQRLQHYDDESITLLFFDTAKQPISELLSQARAQQADFIIGPLLKSNVQSLLDSKGLQLPVLALNSPDDDMIAPDHYFLSLAPEHEAEEVASRMQFDGIKHPLLLLAGGNTPSRMAKNFTTRWHKLDDQHQPPVETYLGNNKKIRDQIESVLGISASEQRISTLKSLLKTNLQSQPRSRHDIDGIYMLGEPSETRLQKSFVDVTISPFAKQPLFYLSARGFSLGHEDLNGVRIADLPLLLSQQPDIVKLRQSLHNMRENWNDDDLRLFALGADSYQLLPNIKQLRVLGNFSVPGLSGQLSVDPQGLVEQQFSWAKVARGDITPLTQ